MGVERSGVATLEGSKIVVLVGPVEGPRGHFSFAALLDHSWCMFVWAKIQEVGSC